MILPLTRLRHQGLLTAVITCRTHIWFSGGEAAGILRARHHPVAKCAINSRAAAAPARFAPIVDEDGPYPTK